MLPTQALQAPRLSTSAPSEETTTSLFDFPAIHISGLLDIALRLGNEALKSKVRKAYDVALEDGLDLAQIDEDKDPNYFKACGVK
ncbi:hypothetical protein N7493_004464 [Penicillium malachiteum]|uniref:Uncharacterized protein n=1 Tax=Penicillium malachiteum TaxID=1324776 RepID=A0AAD6HPD4_9EURO|nr:hypothetical protein N7493_004464 [Penicillium malachiteum]